MLKTDSRRPRSILTLGGTITYSRCSLRPADEDSKIKLHEEYHTRSICPVDEYLGTDSLPFKVTCDAAIRIAKVALSCTTFLEAEEILTEEFKEPISDDRIRQILLYIGQIIYKDYSARSAAAYEEYQRNPPVLRTSRGRPAKDAYNLLMDICNPGSDAYVLRTYTIDCASGECSTAHLHYAFCDVASLHEHIISEAMLHGLVNAREMIILFDGKESLRSTIEGLFPYATLIIGKNHLAQKIQELGREISQYTQNPNYRADYFCRHAIQKIAEGNWKSVFDMKEITDCYQNENRAKIKAIEQVKEYLKRNEKLVRYQWVSEHGYPTGDAIQPEQQTTFEKSKLLNARQLWAQDIIPVYLTLYSKYLGGEWHSYVVPLVRERYKSGPASE